MSPHRQAGQWQSADAGVPAASFDGTVSSRDVGKCGDSQQLPLRALKKAEHLGSGRAIYTSGDKTSAEGPISNRLEHPFQRWVCVAKAPVPAATNQ